MARTLKLFVALVTLGVAISAPPGCVTINVERVDVFPNVKTSDVVDAFKRAIDPQPETVAGVPRPPPPKFSDLLKGLDDVGSAERP